MSAPLLLRYEGEGQFAPVTDRFARTADDQYVIGERYRMAEHEDRSAQSHRHYFAAIRDGWASLPDHLLDQFPTSEHLRKKLLINCGFADERAFTCSSSLEARKLAAWLKPDDDYSIIVVKGDVVRKYTAKSQSTKAMGKVQFQESKQAVLDALASLLDVHTANLVAA